MKSVMIAGAGRIGSLIACLLAESNEFEVYLADIAFHGRDQAQLEGIPHLHPVTLDAQNETQMRDFLQKNTVQAIISSLPYFCNIAVATMAKKMGLHYFDLTEDVEVTKAISILAQDAKTVFVPQCGLAPGFISIVAHDLMSHFDELDTVKLRVGALPQNANNALHYALTWSVDGVINEYANPCYGIVNGHTTELKPLHDLEGIRLDGLSYEAFNTSGGLGSLATSYAGRVKNMTYKTIRYPGHAAKMLLLMDELDLADDRPTLKKILEHAIPKTYQDVVLIYVSVTGSQCGEYTEENYAKKVYPKTIYDRKWSAIQVTTATSICAVVDMLLTNPEQYKGLVLQEQFKLEDFLANRFGQYYA